MDQDYYIYVSSTERLPLGLDVIEDEISTRIEGQGEVSGTGTGTDGWNLDLHFESLGSTNFVLRETLKVLRENRIAEGVSFKINGRHISHSELVSRLGLEG